MMCFCFLRSQTTQVPLAWPLARMCCTFRFHARHPTSGFAPPEVAGDPWGQRGWLQAGEVHN